MTINTTKMFLAEKWKWVQTFLVCFLIAFPCFSEDNKNPLLAQTTPEYWLEKFEKEKGIFTIKIETRPTYGDRLTEKQLEDSILALAKAIKSNPSSLTGIIIQEIPKLPEEIEENISYKEKESRQIIKQKNFNIFFFKNIFESIKDNTVIKLINFSVECFPNKKISTDISKLFFNMLKENKTLQSIGLPSCEFIEEDIVELAKLLLNNSIFKKISVSGLYNLTLKGEQGLLEALRANEAIIFVSFFPISKNFNDLFFKILKEKKSFGWRLNGYKFNKEEELKVAQAMSSNTNLKMYLSDFDDFSVEGKKTLVRAMNNNKSVKELDLSSKVLLHNLSELICELIKNNINIEKIFFGMCQLYEEEVLELAKAISCNSTIKEINLTYLTTLTLKGKNALREVEEKRNSPGWLSFEKKEPLVVLLPNAPDWWLNNNRGR